MYYYFLFVIHANCVFLVLSWIIWYTSTLHNISDFSKFCFKFRYYVYVCQRTLNLWAGSSLEGCYCNCTCSSYILQTWIIYEGSQLVKVPQKLHAIKFKLVQKDTCFHKDQTWRKLHVTTGHPKPPPSHFPVLNYENRFVSLSKLLLLSHSFQNKPKLLSLSLSLIVKSSSEVYKDMQEQELCLLLGILELKQSNRGCRRRSSFPTVLYTPIRSGNAGRRRRFL